MKNPVNLLSLTLLTVTLTACGGAPKKVDSLESAKTAYENASGNQVVVKHAAGELDDARVALANANRVWQDDGKRGRVDHYAYVASQKVKIAELIAERKENDARLESMDIERQKVQLDARSAEVERAKQETLAMQQQLEQMQATVTARGIVATLGDVLFDSGQATLKATAASNIDKIAGFMTKLPERSAIVEGHTDSLGDDDYTLALSRERAFSVRSALIVRGIDPSRITTQNLGEAAPVADNGTAAGRQQNRRVEVIFPDVDTQVSNWSEK